MPSESPAPDARATLPTPWPACALPGQACRPHSRSPSRWRCQKAANPSIPAQRRPPGQCRRLPPQVRTCWGHRCLSLEAAAWRRPHQGSPLPAYPAPCGSRFQPLTLLSLDALRPPPASFQSEEASGPPPPAPIAHQRKWYRPPGPLHARARPEGGQPQAAGTQQMAAGPKNPISWPEGPAWERALPATWPTTDQAATAGPRMTARTIREQPSAHLRTKRPFSYRHQATLRPRSSVIIRYAIRHDSHKLPFCATPRGRAPGEACPEAGWRFWRRCTGWRRCAGRRPR